MRTLAFCAALAVLSCTSDDHHAADAAPGVDAAAPEVDAGPLPDAAPPLAGHPGPPVVDAGMDAALVDAGPVDAALPDAEVDAAPPRMHGLEARVDNTTCFVNGAPPREIVPVAHSAVLSKLDASGAFSVIGAGDRLLVADESGRVRAIDARGDGSGATTVLDLRSDVRTDGLRGLALRPDGKALFAAYVPLDDPLRLVLARFDVDAQGVADRDSLDPLLTLPLMDDARAGGALAFLFDGTLAAALGDAGDAAAASDPLQLAGKLLRLDVSGSSGYAVPADNPFVDEPSVADEVYALDLGAPTSCTVDRITGHLWCADAGDASEDHILHVTAGATLVPIHAFARGSGCGARVGYVSRDAALPDIQGALVFGDACGTKLSALRFDGSLVLSEGEIDTLPDDLAAFGEDGDGRMLVVDAAGDVHALVRPATEPPEFPATVSATGCLVDTPQRIAAASLVPFEVRAPLWSDGAKKRRFIVLPAGETIGFTEHGAWQFPDGTMFMKEFLLDDDENASTPARIMETRFLIKRSANAWEGYSYMWDRDRRDAFLLEGAEIGDYAMRAGAVDSSGASVHRHTFPDRAQCLLCHNAGAGRALGLQTGRMNTDHDYDGFVENQLTAMDYVGLFDQPLAKAPDDLPRFAEPADEDADLEDRARAWLYANCSHCHTPGGTTPVPLDFRYETPLEDTGTCGVSPMFQLASIPDAHILEPGSRDDSEMFFRLSRRDKNQMPPVATLIVEPIGVQVVGDWIDSLTGCP